MKGEDKNQLEFIRNHICQLRASCSLIYFPEEEFELIDKEHVERIMDKSIFDDRKIEKINGQNF